MGNQCWSLGIHIILVIMFLVANPYTCLSATNITISNCSKRERQALLNFKHGVKDAANVLSSWVGDDCCRWERVYCDSVTGYVEQLHLRGRDGDIFGEDFLVGKLLDTSLKELRHLKYLDLSRNDFQGSRIPEFIGSFKELHYLNLSDAGFSGIIPHHIGNLSNLKVLDLSSSQYAPQLMADDMSWISGISSLENLDLSYVYLGRAKNIGMMFYVIPSLVKLSLTRCALSNANLSPPFNSSRTLANIKHLQLRNNRFQGQVPAFFKNITSLESLDLSYNDLKFAWNSTMLRNMISRLLELHLSGCSLQEIHLSPTHLNFSSLSNIQHLDLSNNLFQNRFPSVLTNMTSLHVLDFSGNSLNSSVPVMPNLLELDLSLNRFKQLEDVGFWRQCHLKQLTLSSNRFPMELTDPPTNVSECSQYALERLYWRFSVNGIIPKSLGIMANLRALDLSDSALTGSIPKSLGSLRLLQVLDLSYNKLTGPIPTFNGKLTTLDLSYNHLNGSIPESIGRLASLTILDLQENQLTGPIPESIGRLASLTILNLQENQLTGPIPESIGRLASLQAFYASSNSLTGNIPASIGQLINLQYIDVSNNSLEGVLSEAHFAKLSMLTQLDLASNRKLTFNLSREWTPPFQLTSVDLSSCIIGDRFPQWFQTQRNLEMLRLSNTTISGPLPTWLGNLQVTRHLDLSHNKLSGPLINLPNTGNFNAFGDGIWRALLLHNNLFNESIPRSLCARKNLQVLNLSRNRLTGKFPNCLGDLIFLQYMIFSSNKLSGVIPSSFGHVSSLRWLVLNNNRFTGKLPQELGNLKGVKVLDLGDNKFSGNIPQWIGEKLTALVVLRLHNNIMTGRIPLSLCKSSKLKILDVAHNNLNGPVPHCVGELESMVKKTESPDLFGYYTEPVSQVLKGITLEYTKTLKFLINMDLSSNKLVGEIPVELAALSSLVGLNLSNNHLGGSIPYNIGNMKALTSLDFSRNELTGMIPPSISSLTFLSHLNFSNNKLSGRIPTGNQLQTLIDPSIYAANKDLCGAPLPKNCSNHLDPTTTPQKNDKTADGSNISWLFGLSIMSGFATGFWGVIGVLVFKKKWRHKLFMFTEATTDKIYVAIMVRIAKMKRGAEGT